MRDGQVSDEALTLPVVVVCYLLFVVEGRKGGGFGVVLEAVGVKGECRFMTGDIGDCHGNGNHGAGVVDLGTGKGGCW